MGGEFLSIFFFLSLLIFPVAFRFIAIFVAHFIVFLSREILAGQISRKGTNVICKQY